jgi:hypothetical protein
MDIRSGLTIQLVMGNHGIDILAELDVTVDLLDFAPYKHT